MLKMFLTKTNFLNSHLNAFLHFASNCVEKNASKTYQLELHKKNPLDVAPPIAQG